MKNFLDLIFQAVPLCGQPIRLQLCVALSLIFLPTVIPKELLISQVWNLSPNCYSTVCVIKNASLVEAALTGICMGHTIAENLQGISYCKCRNFDLFIESEVCWTDTKCHAVNHLHGLVCLGRIWVTLVGDCGWS
jgi:hypothetical protein